MSTLSAAPTLTLASGSDTGLSHSDDITSDTSPVIVGTAPPNSLVTVTDLGGTLNLSTRADKNGTFQIVAAGLMPGAHALSAFSTDAAGNFSAPSATLNLDIETSATATSTAAAVPETATSVTFAVHFNQSVSTISPTSFVLATTGTAFGQVTGVTGSGEDYTVTATGLGGTGAVGLAFSANTPTDVAGNQVALTTSVGHPVDDTTSPTTTVVSSDQSGVQGTGASPAISGGGRIVAFISDDPSLIPGTATAAGVGNVYVKDLQTGAITLVTNGNDQTDAVQISLDGTVVAFSSYATNLVPGGTAGGLNLYVAQLDSVVSPGGLSLVPGSIRLVSALEAGTDGFALSGDGSILAFGTDAELPGNAGAGDNSYRYDVATGTYTLIPGAASGDVTSISRDGTEVAYTQDVAVPGTGGEPDPYFDGPAPPDYVEDGQVFKATSNTTTTLDGSGLLPGTARPTGIDEIPDYVTQDPVLSANGATVVFQLARTDGLSSLFSVNLANPGVANPVSPGAETDGSGDYDSDQTVSNGAAVVAYTNNSPTAAGITGEVFSTSGNVTTSLGPALQTMLAAQGNAVAFVEPTNASDTAFVTDEVSLGVSAGIAPIDGNDTIDNTDLTQAAANGLAVSGTSNAPAGSPVLLFVTSAGSSGATDGFTTTVGADGQWTATLPAEIAAGLADGSYFLVVQVADGSGASAQVRRLFTVDTAAPAAPTAPVLDQGSNTGKDGVDTGDATPTLDGLAEPGATVFLDDVSAAGQTRLATATADENGVYTLTSSPLADGSHVLAVQAQDAAGNDSPLSATATITVDTVAPLAPSAPQLAPGQDTAALVEDTINIVRPVLVGSTEPNATVTLSDGNTAIATTKTGSDGSYSIKSPTLANGDHSLSVAATDLAGNTGPASDPLDLTIDTVAPGAPLLANVNGQTLSDGGLSPSFTVTGTAAAQTTITLEVDGVPVDADSADTRASGAYTVSVADLSPGVHTLSVTATDGAGNVSQPSAATTITISSLSAGVPGPNAINGVLIDGPIAGATVFADTNGNGVPDPGEAEAVTTTAGQFTLNSPGGELVATGGTDSETGLVLPGVLTAPAGSVVIDPLTTLLDAYAVSVGQTPQAAQPALLELLGLDPATDLTQTDPETAAAGGDPNLLIASAQVMDSAVVYAELVAAQTGVSTPTAFAASFTALAQQAATGTLNLQDGANTLVNLATAAVGIADPGFVLPNGLAEDAATILDSGNYDLGTASGHAEAPAALTQVEAIERVEQGQAAPQLAAASNDQAEADQVAETYSDGLPDAVTAAETPVLAPPLLAPADDTGISAQDNFTSDTTPTFTGTAPPGATVILALAISNEPGTFSIVGLGTADAGGGYAVAITLPAGRDEIVAMEATPGEATASGTQFSGPTDLTDAQVTEVTVGDLLETSGAVPPPTIQDVEYTESSANNATATSLYLTGDGSYDIQEGAVYTVTADGNPVSVAAAQGTSFGILTTPLAAGTYSLVVTETALDGESVQSAPTTVTVTAPGSLSIQAEAAGPVAGGSIVSYDSGDPELVIAPDKVHPDATTDTSGAASVPAQSNVPGQGTTLLYPTDAAGLELEGGQDALTGLAVPVNLSAPPGASVITPATSLLNQADADATPAETVATATDYAYENSRVDTALGLPTTVDLSTADPLAMAEAGNPTLFLKNVELLDTMFLLIPFTEDGDAGTDTADPLYVIDKALGSNIPFDDFIGGTAPAITTQPIDFTSAAQVLAWLTTYDGTLISGSYDNEYDASVLPTVAAIIAASNAAIETQAAASISLADTISYALAVERVAVGGEEQALAALASTFNFPVPVAQQQAGFATLQTDYTGSGLQAAVADALAQTVQVTGFSPASASTGAAQQTFTITFSASVSGVTAGDFTVSGGAGLAGEAVAAVTPLAGSDGTAYTVTVGTGVGDGVLTLGFTPNGLTSADGTPLATGTFAAPQSYSSTIGNDNGNDTPQGLATGDFNGDGHTDVLLANESADGLTLFLGQGDGSFVAEPAIYTGSNGPEGAFQVVTGDFNGDGKLDAVTLNYAYSYNGESTVGDLTVSTMLGNGDGTFAGPVQTDVGQSAVDMVAGDFNGDGKLDLAVLDGSPDYDLDGTVQLFYGNGDGTFTAGPKVDLGAPLNSSVTNADHIVAADLNGDGKPDLVIATSSATTGEPGVAILLGNGQGGFTLAAQPSLGFGVSSGVIIAVGEVNGDGIPDIVAVPQETEGSETAAVLLGNGDGSFKPAISVPLALPPGGSVSGNTINGDDENVAVMIGDVTGDGKPDIVVENSPSGFVVAPGNGDGTFGPAYTDAAGVNNAGEVDAGLFGFATLADVNGDGRPDLITTDASGSEASTSVGPGISVSLGTAQTVLPASASVTVDRAAAADPALNQVSGAGTLTQSGTSYTLDLGTLSQDSNAAAVLALMNEAAAPADDFDGTFSAPTGSGFTVTGADLPAAITAGQSYAGLTFTTDTSTLGSHSETITFAPRDLTNDPGATLSVPADVAEGDPTTATEAPADADGADVALALAPLTLTVTDDVVATGTLVTPTITGTVADQADSDAASIQPFADVTIADANAGQTEAVTVTPSSIADGTLLDPNAATDGSSIAAGLVELNGTATQVSADIDALMFTPTAHEVAPGGTVTTSFTIADTDTAGQTASNGATSVVATAASDLPQITGAVAGQATTDAASLAPFAHVVVSDPDAGATEALTLTLTAGGAATDADGTLSGAGLIKTGTGTYTLAAGTPAAATAALDALVFTPTAQQVAPGQTVTTGVAIADADNHGTSATDATTTILATGSPLGGGATPFADLAVGSPVAGDMVTVVVGLSPTISGSFGAGFGGVADAAGTAYSFTGSVAATNALLKTLTFAAAPGSPAQTGVQASVTSASGTASLTDTGSGHDFLTAITNDTLTTDGAGSTVVLGPDNASAFLDGNDSVTGGAGQDSVATAAGNVLVTPGTGPLSFTNGSGISTVLGGAGSVTVDGGTGGGVFTGGASGGNRITAGQLPTTIQGGGAGDVAYLAGSQGDLYLGGAGSETVYANASTGNDVLYTGAAGGSGSGAAVLGSGNDQVFARGRDLIGAGLGSDTIGSIGTADVLAYGTGGRLDFSIDGTGIDTVGGGAGSNTVYGGGGGGVFFGGSAGGNELIAGQLATTLFGGGAGDTLFTEGSAGDLAVAGPGAETIYGGGSSGNNTIYTGAFDGSGNTVAVLGAGNDAVYARGSDTIGAGAGSDTIGAVGAANVLAYGTTGRLLFTDGTGSATVGGGAGSNTVIGGQGGGEFFGGSAGANQLVAGVQASTLVGAGSGDVLTATGSAGDVLLAGAGNETLNGTLSSGNDFFAAGSGATSIQGGAGQDRFFAGLGAATIGAGTGADVFGFVNGSAGGSVTLLNFSATRDQVYLQGYAAGAGAAAVTGATTANGSTTIVLPDKTQITFVGLGSLAGATLT